MKKLIFLAAFLLCVSYVNAQSANPKYNKALADSLGADDYGMKSYVLVILKGGTNKTASKVETDSLFKGHLTNINRLAKQGLLVVAGPMQQNDKNYMGIFILNVKTTAEADKLLETDPAIQQKLLAADLYGWYGSAALPQYLKDHEKIEKVRIGQ